LSKKPLLVTKQRIVILSKIRLDCQVSQANCPAETFCFQTADQKSPPSRNFYPLTAALSGRMSRKDGSRKEIQSVLSVKSIASSPDGKRIAASAIVDENGNVAEVLNLSCG